MRTLYWDIETSPLITYTWRTGWKISIPEDMVIRRAAIICICWKWSHNGRVHSLTWDDGDDREMIKQFAEVIKEADEMGAHNGDKFDMRWYKGRHLKLGLPPIPMAKTFDTYKMAKRLFVLDSYRLDELGKELLGRGKIKTNIGWWKECIDVTQPDPELRAKGVKRMVKYCKEDVRLVQDVHEAMMSYDNPVSHAAVAVTGNDKDRWMCPYCASAHVYTSKRRVTPKGMVQYQMQCHDCFRYYTIANNVHGFYEEAKRNAKKAVV
jgi:hypothetical protein